MGAAAAEATGGAGAGPDCVISRFRCRQCPPRARTRARHGGRPPKRRAHEPAPSCLSEADHPPSDWNRTPQRRIIRPLTGIYRPRRRIIRPLTGIYRPRRRIIRPILNESALSRADQPLLGDARPSKGRINRSKTARGFRWEADQPLFGRRGGQDGADQPPPELEDLGRTRSKTGPRTSACRRPSPVRSQVDNTRHRSLAEHSGYPDIPMRPANRVHQAWNAVPDGCLRRAPPQALRLCLEDHDSQTFVA